MALHLELALFLMGSKLGYCNHSYAPSKAFIYLANIYEDPCTKMIMVSKNNELLLILIFRIRINQKIADEKIADDRKIENLIA